MSWIDNLFSGLAEGIRVKEFGPDYRQKRAMLEAQTGLVGAQTEGAQARTATEALTQEQLREAIAQGKITREEYARLAQSGAIPSASPEVTGTVGGYQAHQASARASNTTADQNVRETANMGTPKEAAAARAAALRKTNADAAESGARGALYGSQVRMFGNVSPDDPARAEAVRVGAELSRAQGKFIAPSMADEKRFPGIGQDIKAAWAGMGSAATTPLQSRAALAGGDKLATLVASLSGLVDNIETAPDRMGKLTAGMTFTQLVKPIAGNISRALESGRVTDQDRAVYTAMLVPLSQLGSVSTIAMLQTPQYRALAKERIKYVGDLFQKLSDQGRSSMLGEAAPAAGAAPAAPPASGGFKVLSVQ